MGTFFLRHPDLAVVGQAARCTFVLPGKSPFALEPCDPERMSAALRILTTPRQLEELEALVDLQQLLTLVLHGFVLTSEDPSSLVATGGVLSSAGKPCKRLVLGMTGAVGSVSAVRLLLPLVHHFAERVDVVLTGAACRIVRPEIFAYLGVDAWTDAFSPRGDVNVPHIFLAAADIVVVAPASAHTIHKIASGACSDLLSLVAAATRAPLVIAPSMNDAMWSNPAIQDNVRTLRRRGAHVVEPGLGREVSNRDAPSWAFGSAGFEASTWLPLLTAVLGSPSPSPSPSQARAQAGG